VHGLSSAVVLSNVNGEIVERYSYDAFGRPTVRIGAGSNGIWLTNDDTTASTPVSAYGNCWMFTARQWDMESGLYYYRARFYNPSLGRFLQTDPIRYYGGWGYSSFRPVVGGVNLGNLRLISLRLSVRSPNGIGTKADVFCAFL
jgi:RHS repeat-associated protein